MLSNRSGWFDKIPHTVKARGSSSDDVIQIVWQYMVKEISIQNEVFQKDFSCILFLLIPISIGLNSLCLNPLRLRGNPLHDKINSTVSRLGNSQEKNHAK